MTDKITTAIKVAFWMGVCAGAFVTAILFTVINLIGGQ